MTSTLRLSATGFALIAVCYGFARFAFGLFLPEIRADLALSPTIGGFIAGGSFLGYCIAIMASAYLTERIGPRLVAGGAGLVAAAGLAAIAMATSAPALAAAVLFAGASTGLASPPLAAAVSRAVRRERQDATNTFINAGTSAGVALTGPVALLLGAQWRLVFALFAMASLAVAIAAFVFIARDVTPRGANDRAVGSGRMPELSADLARLMSAAFLMGAASTAIWSFGGELTTRSLDWAGQQTGLLWIVIGAAGIFGALAGTLVARFGVNTTHFFALLALTCGIVCIGWSGTTATLAFFGAALFGAAYILLTGVYLVWGISAMPERPAAGLTIAFLMVGVGQAAGSPVFGLLLSQITADFAVVSFAGLGVLAGMVRRKNSS